MHSPNQTQTTRLSTTANKEKKKKKTEEDFLSKVFVVAVVSPHMQGFWRGGAMKRRSACAHKLRTLNQDQSKGSAG